MADTEDEGGRGQNGMYGQKIRQHEWLAPTFIRKEHCDEAAARIENHTTEEKGERTGESSVCVDVSVNSTLPD